MLGNYQKFGNYVQVSAHRAALKKNDDVRVAAVARAHNSIFNRFLISIIWSYQVLHKVITDNSYSILGTIALMFTKSFNFNQ